MDSVEDILNALEHDDELLKFREPGTNLPLWPYVRWDVLTYLVYTRKNIGLQPVRHAIKWQVALKLIWFMLLRNPFLLLFRKKKVLFFCHEISSIVKENGLHFNQYVDYFYYAFPDDTTLIEESAFGKRVVPRIHNSVYSKFFLRAVAMIVARFVKPAPQRINSEIDNMFRLIRERVVHLEANPTAFDQSIRNLKKNVPQIVAEHKLYSALLKWTRPRVIFIESACYGDNAHLIAAAKTLNILVGEYQHGFINKDHFAYNYGPGIKTSDYVNYLPDVFMSYGQYWRESVNVPVNIIDIGNPHLSESTKDLKDKARKVLVLGAGGTPESLIDITEQIAEKYQPLNYEVVFRPHPYQWTSAAVTYNKLVGRGIKLNTGNDLYSEMRDASVVIGELSTTLYEAKAFDAKVYMIRNSMAELYGQELTALFPYFVREMDPEAPYIAAKTETLWADNWMERYRKFLSPYLTE